MNLPLIIPKSSFSSEFPPVTFAGINIPLFKKLTTSTELENDKHYKIIKLFNFVIQN